MSPQFSENLLTSMYVEVDDLYKAFLNYRGLQRLGKFRFPTRTPSLSPSEIVTIIVAYHVSGYKCFEYYYRECILGAYLHCFPKAPAYRRFVALVFRSVPLLLLWLLYKCTQSIRTGRYYIDSKKLEVCHIRREGEHKVFKGIARKGKTSTGWFFGLKLHLVINHLGQIVSFLITPGHVADNNHAVLHRLLQGLSGRCCGDKGYWTTLFETFLREQGLILLVRPKKNMKQKPPALPADICFMKQRSLIESVIDILDTVCNIEHSRHRSPVNGLANILAALIAYQYMEQKPHVFIPGAANYLQAAA